MGFSNLSNEPQVSQDDLDFSKSVIDARGDPDHILGNNIPLNLNVNFEADEFENSRGGKLFHNYKSDDGRYLWRESADRLFADPAFLDGMYHPMKRNVNAGPEERSEWALEMIARIRNNITYGGVALTKINELSNRSKLDLYRLLNMYTDEDGAIGVPNLYYSNTEGNSDNSPLGRIVPGSGMLANTNFNILNNIAWDGIFRAGRGELTNTANYVGIGIWHKGVQGINALFGKQGANTLWKKVLSGALTGNLAGIEGGIWTSAYDYQDQRFQIEGQATNPETFAGQIPEDNPFPTEIDKGQLAQSALMGYSIGFGLDRTIAGLPLIPTAVKEIGEVYERIDWSKMTSTTPSIVPPIKLRLTRNENKRINALDISKKEKTKLRDEVKRIKSRFAENEDFSPVFFKGVKISRGKDGEPRFKIEWGDKDGKILKYNYHITPKNMTDDEYKEKIVGTVYNDIMDLLKRAKAKDPEAQQILGQADWYRQMQNTIRSEFGGMGDVFADVLSATSAQTSVRQNFDNTMIIMKKFSQGDYDKEIEAFIKHLDEGGNIGNKIPKDFPLIANDAGKLFNTNSPKATIALLGMFRDIKAGGNPKTINFLGNLLGQNPEATVDIWANRYIGKIATGKWYPPFADVEITGAYRADATFENPNIGSEFGFAQDMFRSVTDRLNANSEFLDYMDMGALEPRDIQAVAWFLEKNRWDKGGWTSEPGGNFSDELKFAGQTDQARVKELRRIINSKNTLPEDKLKAEAELDTLKVDQERLVVGVSRQQGGDKPTNFEQAELSENLTAPLKDNEMINAFQANNNLGVWKEDNKLQFERSLNMEIIAKPGWDQTEFEKTFINELQKNNQWSGFIAKPLKENVFTGYDDFPNASPGFELFMNRQDGTTDVIKEVNQILADADVPFSYITDSRYKDLPRTQTGSNIETEAGVTGIRIMYIPDYDDAFDPSKASEMKMDAFKKFTEVVDKLGELGYIQTTQHYEFDLRVYNKGTDY